MQTNPAVEQNKNIKWSESAYKFVRYRLHGFRRIIANALSCF